MVDLAHLTLAGAARAIAARRLSSVELVEATLARIEAFDPRLDSHVTVMAESARAAARSADEEIAAGRRRGPLHGVTVALQGHLRHRGGADRRRFEDPTGPGAGG